MQNTQFNTNAHPSHQLLVHQRAANSITEATQLMDRLESALSTLESDWKSAELARTKTFSGLKNSISLMSHWDNRGNRMDARRVLDGIKHALDTGAIPNKNDPRKEKIEAIRRQMSDKWSNVTPLEIIEECTEIITSLQKDIARIEDSLKVVSGDIEKLPNNMPA